MTTDKKIFWFDTETSGLDKVEHGIIQIAALIEVNGEVVGEFESKVRLFPTKKVEAKALETNGFTVDQIRREFPETHGVYNNLRTFLAKHGTAGDKANRFIMAGYNSQFDCDMLAQWHQDITRKPFAYWDYFQFSPIDPLPFFRILRYAGILTTEDTRLESICKFYGIEIDAHDALSDIRATRTVTKLVLEAYLSQMQGKPWGLLGALPEFVPQGELVL